MRPAFVLLILAATQLVTLDAVCWDGRTGIIRLFNHDLHDEKVAKPRKLECTVCHEFGPEMAQSSMRGNLKTVCHSCHQGEKSENANAPKACFSCHRTMETMKQIKPKNHGNAAWSQMHGLEGRVDGERCLECHTTSSCVQCHQARNHILPVNHARNYRFTHSIIARMQPHQCDACHAKSYCADCHLGKKGGMR
ncbi:MAG: cytochrome c3 family protein [Bdellovibrionota bacterium]